MNGTRPSSACWPRILVLFVALLALSGHGFAGADCSAPAPKAAGTFAPIALHGLRVGLALGSGSAHGFAHVGVIRELEARGLDVRVVSGTSVGALIGALWASGLSAREVERIARERHWDDMGRFALSRQGLMTNDRLREELTRLFAGRLIESWPRRFGAVATNIDNGHSRLLMSGDGALAVQASAAVPMWFAPVSVAGESLADGALVEPVPVASARAMGADFVIAVDVSYRPYEDKVDGLAGYGFQAMHILTNTLAASQIRESDVAIRLDVHRQLLSCGADAVIAAGREAVRRAWPDIVRGVRLHTAQR